MAHYTLNQPMYLPSLTHSLRQVTTKSNQMKYAYFLILTGVECAANKEDDPCRLNAMM